MNNEPLIVRFNEVQRYDINLDCDVTLFTAVTGKGSYHCEVPVATSRHLREKRAAFREKVIEYMSADVTPCEVSLA